LIEKEFFGRADRILYRGSWLKPKVATLVGTKAVKALKIPAIEKEKLSCPDYLFPSDHYGVCIDFDL